jgi:hypothetical protein
VSGDYTVKATFTEPKYMNLNDHPHPYGIVVAATTWGRPSQSYLYCAAYGNGNFIVRGFGPEPFQMNGRRGEANAAVHKAAGPGEPVTQEIAMSVKGSRVGVRDQRHGRRQLRQGRCLSRRASSSRPMACTASGSPTTTEATVTGLSATK